jgi:RNA polymerase sigma-70 factor (ECF subfamily)
VFVKDGSRELAARVLTEIRNPACPDAFLVNAAQHGSAEAFGVLVDRYHRKVYGIVYRMCGAGDGEDLTQDIFLRALQALRSFKFQGEASFRTWLYRIAVNACINELRKRKRHREVDGPSLDEMVETEGGWVSRSVADNSHAPHEIVEQQETRAAVHTVLQTLSPKHQAVLTLVDLQGMEYEEAASTIGCPLGTLKSRVARARAAFAVKYRRYLQGTTPVLRANA